MPVRQLAFKIHNLNSQPFFVRHTGEDLLDDDSSQATEQVATAVDNDLLLEHGAATRCKGEIAE